MSRTSRAPRKAQKPAIGATPVLRFIGEHRYFAQSGDIVTSGVVEVCGVIGQHLDYPTSEFFFCERDQKLHRIPSDDFVLDAKHMRRDACKDGCLCLQCEALGIEDRDEYLSAVTRCRCFRCMRRKHRLSRAGRRLFQAERQRAIKIRRSRVLPRDAR